MKIDFISFDQVPSFKGASQHILGGLRKVIDHHDVRLISLGESALPVIRRLVHHPLAIKEKNYLKRGLRFRERVHALLSAKSDLVHFRTPWEGVAVADRGLPALYEVNGLPSVEIPYHYRNVPPSVLDTFRVWERRCLRHASIIICPSPTIRDFLLQRDGDVIRAPIEIFRNAYEPAASALPAPQVPSDSGAPLRIVYLGTLSPWQGVLWSLKAISDLGGRITLTAFVPTARTLRRYFLRRVTRFGLGESVHLESPIGRLEMAARMREFDLGFAPLLSTPRNTEQGCFPIKLFDYLVHGLPVLASDLEVNRQVVEDGVNGRLFQPNTTRDLIRVLSELTNDREALARLRAGINPSLQRHWSWDQYSASLEQLYCRIEKGFPVESSSTN